MPSPMETLLRVQASPLPTQIVLGDCGSTVIAPMDSTGSLSNTGLNVVPPFVDFQTPPLAAPTYTVSRPFSLTAAMAATRPLIAAEPMFRAPRPETVSESNLTSCARAAAVRVNAAAISVATAAKLRIELRISVGDLGQLSKCLKLLLQKITRNSSARELFSGRRFLRFRFRGRHREERIVQVHILLNLLN